MGIRRVPVRGDRPNWHKWLPSDPTSAHWYDVERLERLAGAYVAQDQNRRTVRDFIADFRGMARSATQKTILDATGLSRKPLAELFPDDKPDHGTFAKLLTKLQDATKPVRAKDLGIIGEVISPRRSAAVRATAISRSSIRRC